MYGKFDVEDIMPGGQLVEVNCATGCAAERTRDIILSLEAAEEVGDEAKASAIEQAVDVIEDAAYEGGPVKSSWITLGYYKCAGFDAFLLIAIKSRASTHSCSRLAGLGHRRRLAELGPDGCRELSSASGPPRRAASLLAAAKAHGNTPAHLAAQEGHGGCLRVLHELGGDL